MKNISIHLRELAGKILIFMGCFFGAPFVFVTLFVLSSIGTPGRIPSFFILLGIDLVFAALVVTGIRIKRRVRRFKEYVRLISEEHTTSLWNIAKATGKTVEFIRRDLQTMIKLKYFHNAHIDESKGEIIIPHPLDGVDAAGLNTETVVCENCGSEIIKRINDVGVCEYCGSAIV